MAPKMNSRNTSGVVGVSWNKNRQLWISKINVGKKEVLLGYFQDFIEAIASRKSAEIHGVPVNIEKIACTGTLTQEILKQKLHYSPETGLFTWLDKFGNLKNGVIAGCVHIKNGGKAYIDIEIYGKAYCAQNLTYLYMCGIFPYDLVDHISGNGCDNKWANTRDVTLQDNLKNKRLYSSNSSGTSGVWFRKARNCWVATITNNLKFIWLGSFETKEEAIEAREGAEIKYDFHINHGTVRPL